ncbi:MAG: arginine--tRNA ligase [bacterium]
MTRRIIEHLLFSALAEKGINDLRSIKIDVSPRLEFGDYATNAAIVTAKKLSIDPLQLAEELTSLLKKAEVFERVEIAKPGFINFFLKADFIHSEIKNILKADTTWGETKRGNGQKILLEYVSANPTGPLHVGHGRWAVIGDIIARALKAAGYQVETEFYVNNIGNQVEKLTESVNAARAGQEPPENGYGGSYIKDVEGNSTEEMLEFILAGQKKVMSQVGVNFDRFFFESELHAKDKVRYAIDKLTKKGKTFEEGGAIWFKSQEIGDDKNRVLVRENGVPTYFAADIAYHLDKFERGYDRLINIWGTDHHGYINRLKGALKALDLPVEKFEIIIGQLVTLYRGDEPVRMSKRTGEMVTLEEVIEEIGADATRFFFAATDVNSHLDFDLELAKKQSNDNPVFYVQYAHARICSILGKSTDQKLQTTDLTTLTHPAERELMLKLLSFPDVVESAAQLRHPQRLTEYGKELATVFHHFYEKCRVLGNPARLVLVDTTRITLRNVLNLLGVSAPDKM